MTRWLRHLFSDSARRMFPRDVLERIAVAVARDETRHRGEICFAVESSLHWSALWNGQQARDRAAAAFARLRVWDTDENNGVLIYLLLADRRIEMVADRGLNGRVSAEQWRGVCQRMEEQLRAGDPEAAIIAGVTAAGDLLAEHFPRLPGDSDHNELPDLPQILD